MKRLFASLVVAGLFVGLLAGPVAAAGVQRTQLTTTVYTIAVSDLYIHTYTVTTNCDSTITITGFAPAPYATSETITGALGANGVISFFSTYGGPWLPGYTWGGTFSVSGGLVAADIPNNLYTSNNTYTGTVTAATPTTTAWANHGAYVSATGSGDDAAHSCIGMPVVAQQ